MFTMFVGCSAAAQKWKNRTLVGLKMSIVMILVIDCQLLRLHWHSTHFFFLSLESIDWCCFYYFATNSLAAVLEALCARLETSIELKYTSEQNIVLIVRLFLSHFVFVKHILRFLRRLATRVPELSFRDCARRPNNRALRCPKLSVIDVTAQTLAIFERLALVPGWGRFGKTCHHAFDAHTPNTHSAAISRCAFSPNLFLRSGPWMFWSARFLIWPSPGTLLATSSSSSDCKDPA